VAKTLHLTNAWHAKSGGIATYYRALAVEAQRQRRAMALVVPGERDEVRRDGFVTTYTIASSPSPYNRAYRMIRPNRWPGVNARVLEIVRAESPDLVEICDKYSLHYLAGVVRKGWISLAKRPVLLGLSCERMDDNFRTYVGEYGPGLAFVRLYMKWNYFGYFDHHVTVSEHTAAELRASGRGHVRPRGIYVRGMGVDLGHFRPERRSPCLRSELLGGNGADTLLLYVGRLAPEKNLALLFEALELLPLNYRLAVAGDGQAVVQRQKF
jgi:glycosyltransferase involved in cell wall biosynthesis